MYNFYNKNYIIAALDFKKYYEINDNKKSYQAEVGLYNYIYCLYLSSRDYDLDQENSYNAIYAIYKFIHNYPNSSKKIHIQIILNILLKKIEKKTFQIAYINYNIGNYYSAFLIFKNFIIKYPNSRLFEQALFYTLSAQLKFAISINHEKIKKQRLEKMLVFLTQCKKHYILYEKNLEKIIYNIKYIMNTLHVKLIKNEY